MSARHEQVLFTIGPFGTAVCPGPYSVFTWQKTNVTRVELTETRVRGRRQRSFFIVGRSTSGGRVVFDIPYANVLMVRRYGHPVRLGLMDVLEFTFVSGGEEKVLSIAAYKGPVSGALEVLRRRLPVGCIRT